MWVPAFTRADEEHPISGVANHVAVVTKSEFEFVAGFCSLRYQHEQLIVSACHSRFGGCASVGKSEERFSGKGRSLDGQKAGELKWNQALAGTIRVDANRSYPVNGIVWTDGGFDLVVSSSESSGERNSSGQAVGAPDIVEITASGFFALPEQLGLLS